MVLSSYEPHRQYHHHHTTPLTAFPNATSLVHHDRASVIDADTSPLEWLWPLNSNTISSSLTCASPRPFGPMSSTDTGSEQGAVPKFVNLSASALPVVMTNTPLFVPRASALLHSCFHQCFSAHRLLAEDFMLLAVSLAMEGVVSKKRAFQKHRPHPTTEAFCQSEPGNQIKAALPISRSRAWSLA